MPHFFLPAATDAETAESNYAAIRQFVAQEMGALDERRIFRIDYAHGGKVRFAEVGQVESHERATVIAIFKKLDYPLYFVCTPDRGVIRGGPILVGEHEVSRSVDFDTATE
jgi:hypothetical protein